MAQITWTHFADRGAASKREQASEWADLAQHLQTAGPFSSKAACPWIKLARFGNARSGKGALRHDGNMLEITGVEGDYDGEQISPEEALTRLERAGLRAIVYTSPSHTEERPRWRVLAPLAQPHKPEHRTQLLARVNGALGGVLTDESFTLSQSYYYGRVAGQDYRVLVTFDDPDEGSCVDTASELDEIAVAKAPRDHVAEGGERTTIAQRVEKLGRRLRTGDGRRELLKSYIGEKSARGLCADEIRTLVDDVVTRFFDPSDAPDWANLNEMIRSFTDADYAERQRVQEVVGPFVTRVAQQAQEAADAPRQFRLKRADVDFSTLRPVKWTITGFVAAGEVVVWAGQPGVGKTTTFAALALLVAGFGSQLGSDIEVDRPRRVVIVSEHAGQYERLLYGFSKRFDIPVDTLRDQVILFDAARLRASEIADEVAELLRQAGGDEPPLVILDTASASFDVADENSNAEIGSMLAALKQPVAATGAPLWIIAHAAKALGREDSDITPRGASAYIGDVHGTGSVFRDKNIPASTFIKSLKNRNEREFAEIEVRTEVLWHEVVDERGVIQRIGIRIGVPIKATATRAQAADDAREGSEAAKRVMKSNKAKREELHGAVVATLMGAPHRTMSRSELVNNIESRGFTRSPAYDAIKELIDSGVLTLASGRIHLNGTGPKDH